jgi:hypothetical protein
MLGSTAVHPSSLATKLPAVERRTAPRYRCTLEGYYRPLDDESSGLWWLATVVDISVKGVGLILTRKLKPDTLLSIELENTTTHFRRTLLARVVHATAQPDNGWRVGCAFAKPLSEDDLQALLW